MSVNTYLTFKVTKKLETKRKSKIGLLQAQNVFMWYEVENKNEFSFRVLKKDRSVR